MNEPGYKSRSHPKRPWHTKAGIMSCNRRRWHHLWRQQVRAAISRHDWEDQSLTGQPAEHWHFWEW